MRQFSLWKQLFCAAVLVFLAASGLAHLVYSGRFMKRWYRGGEMLTEWNRSGIQLVGAILSGFAIYGLYVLLRN